MKKTLIAILLSILTFNVMAQQKIVQTAGRTQLGEFAPEFAHLNDDILFGEVWSRNDLLSLRDRSLVTITALISQGITDSSLTHHLEAAKKNGITRTEIAEIITHAAFYAGWPKAWAAFRHAKEIWADDTSANDAIERSRQELTFPIGEPNTAYARYFKGNSHLAPIAPKNLSSDETTIQGYSNVTFEPGCRNNWHIHHGAHQILICVGGKGWYQEWGKPAIELRAGDIIDIPEGVKHWHGAQADSWFQHLATHAKTSGDEHNEWLEPVSDEDYNKINAR
ncbi:MAG: carboxymuconolactone decarboxylase family protein [Candidatus Limisoma sp.]